MYLLENSLDSISWNILHPQEPYLFFAPKDFSLQEEYNEGFKVDELMQKPLEEVEAQSKEELKDYEDLLEGAGFAAVVTEVNREIDRKRANQSAMRI